MRRLALAVLLVATNAHADSTKLADLPAATNPLEMVGGVFTRWEAPWANQCLLATTDNHGIALRWIPAESTLERTTFSFLRKNEEGKLERQEPQWAYEPIVRIETVTKVAAVRIAERGDLAVYAYREADAVVVFAPGRSAVTTTTGGNRESAACSMATAVLSTKSASECKTTAGCGRLSRMANDGKAGFAITLGVSEATLAVSIK